MKEYFAPQVLLIEVRDVIAASGPDAAQELPEENI